MADILLAARGQIPPLQLVGKNQINQFIKAQPELQIKQNRKFYSQRAKYKDPVIIDAQFKRVEETRLLYNILTKYTYNFNKTGFIIGVAAILKVVISLDIIGQVNIIQLGNQEQVIIIKGINAARQTILPFIILIGKLY